MTVFQRTVSVTTDAGKVSYRDIKPDVQAIIDESGVTSGIVCVQTSHTTCSIIFEEYVHDHNLQGQEFLQADLDTFLDKMIPRELEEGRQYRYPGPKHQEFLVEYHDEHPDFPGEPSSILNGDAHLRASLLGSSQTFAIVDGTVNTGEFGHIYLVDWDQNRERTRKAAVCVLGE